MHSGSQFVLAFDHLAVRVEQHPLVRAHARLAHLPRQHAEALVNVPGKERGQPQHVADERFVFDDDEIEQAVVQDRERRDARAVAVLS